MLALPAPPPMEPDAHCQTPYECPFWNFCTKDKPSRWIFHLPGGAQTFHSLSKLGITVIDDIPAGFHLAIYPAPDEGQCGMDRQWTQEFAGLGTISRHHLDFETFMPAVPKFPQTRPYQTIPTQWSNHVELGNGEVRHDEFFCLDPKDPREDFFVSFLVSLGHEGASAYIPGMNGPS